MRASLPRWAAVVLTFAVVAATLASGARMARRQTIAFLDELPATVQAIEDAAFRDGSAERRRSSGPIHNLQRAATDLQAAINGVGTPASLLGRHVAVAERFDVRNYLLSAWQAAVGLTARLIVIAVLTFVLLLGGDAIRKKLDIAGPRFDRQILTIDVIPIIDRQIQRYFVAPLSITL